MRILILRGGALGDFLVTLPALAALRRHWPDARIELAGNATAAALGVTCGVLDAVHSQHEARWGALYEPAPLPADFARWLAAFDAVVNFWPDPSGELARHFPRHPQQRWTAGAAAPACAPAADHFSAALAPLGVLAPAPRFAWRAPAAARVPSRVALHPGSGSPRKNWPLERWAALARWLADDCAAELQVISGEAEAPDVLAGVGRALRGRPLEELADELAHCGLFVGHDSGVSHLAAATGVPCVLLFGPTDPAIWAPPGPHVRVLRRGADVAAITLADVQAAVAAVRRDQS